MTVQLHSLVIILSHILCLYIFPNSSLLFQNVDCVWLPSATSCSWITKFGIGDVRIKMWQDHTSYTWDPFISVLSHAAYLGRACLFFLMWCWGPKTAFTGVPGPCSWGHKAVKEADHHFFISNKPVPAACWAQLLHSGERGFLFGFAVVLLISERGILITEQSWDCWMGVSFRIAFFFPPLKYTSNETEALARGISPLRVSVLLFNLQHYHSRP